MGEDTEPSDWVSGVTGRPCNLSLELAGSPHTCRIGGLPGRMNHGPELDKEETPPTPERLGKGAWQGNRDTGRKQRVGRRWAHFRGVCGGVELILRTKGVKLSSNSHFSPPSLVLSQPPPPRLNHT